MQNGTVLAALDLGSNSFRLEIGRLDHGQIERIDYLKETVRQGGELNSDGLLSQQGMQKGWDCLARFAERLDGIALNQIRAVATQTLREAKNKEEFLQKAQDILGFPVDVISGKEEARLIYSGVVHHLAQTEEKRLVVDIGGRSTEFILGQGFEPKVLESYPIGSVSWSSRYFPNGHFTQKAFDQATLAAKAVLEEIQVLYNPSHWQAAYGSSGAINAVAELLIANNRSTGQIQYADLTWIVDKCIKGESASKIKMEGLRDDRRTVIGGAISVLMAIFELLQIKTLQSAQGALRHGVLYDLLDRDYAGTDLRGNSIKKLAKRFSVDQQQSDRVLEVADYFLSQLSQQLETALQNKVHQELAWAVELHEIGFIVSHNDYHKHGAYLLDHVDAIGFSIDELHKIGLLVLGHKGKLKKMTESLAHQDFVKQLLALRLAVLICHGRQDHSVAEIKDFTIAILRSVTEPKICITASKKWALEFPQSAYLLHEEGLAWEKVGYQFLIEWQ